MSTTSSFPCMYSEAVQSVTMATAQKAKKIKIHDPINKVTLWAIKKWRGIHWLTHKTCRSTIISMTSADVFDRSLRCWNDKTIREILSSIDQLMGGWNSGHVPYSLSNISSKLNFIGTEFLANCPKHIETRKSSCVTARGIPPAA